MQNETAARQLRSEKEIQFVVVGSGVEVDRITESAQDLDNVRFIPQVDKSEIASFFAWADAFLVHLKDEPLFSITIPSKLQTYLYAARPILCGVSGDAADIVRNSGAGLCFTPENDNELAEAVLKLKSMSEKEREQMGNRGYRYYQSEFSIAASMEKYEGLFATILGQTVESPEVATQQAA